MGDYFVKESRISWTYKQDWY